MNATEDTGLRHWGPCLTIPQTDLVMRCHKAGVLGYTPEEMTFVYDTMAELRPSLLLEWGTNVGHSARMFWEAKRLLALDTEIHSIELSEPVSALRPEDEGKQRGHHVQGLDVTLHVGVGVPTAVRLHAESGREPTLLYVDDNHSGPGLTHDLGVLTTEMPDAVILVHDVHLSTARFTECDLAVRDFSVRHPEFVADEVLGPCGMVRLWPR